MKSFRWSITVTLILSVAARADAGRDATHFNDQVRPFFVRHCLACHAGKKPKGDLPLDRLAPDFADKASREQWLAVLERLKAGTMPPKAKPRPPKQEVQALSDWIGAQVAAADRVRRTAEGRVVLRRLNRVEYENTVRDLLGVKLDLKERLPLDSSADGFDNVGAALHVSSFLMERYLEAADTALNVAIANGPRPPIIKKRYSLQETHQVKTTEERVFRKAEDGAEFDCAMEDVLEVYHRPYDEKRPLVCLAEASKQRIGATVQPLPAEPGQPERFDYEYVRNGTANRFRISQPLLGWRTVQVTERRTAKDFAEVLRWRAAVFAYLHAAHGHPTAEQVFAAVRQHLPHISLATVYKALEALVDACLANRIAGDSGPTRYDGRGEPHYHLRCQRSGQVIDLPLPYDPHLLDKLDPQLVETLRREGFEITGHRLELVGRFTAIGES